MQVAVDEFLPLDSGKLIHDHNDSSGPRFFGAVSTFLSVPTELASETSGLHPPGTFIVDGPPVVDDLAFCPRNCGELVPFEVLSNHVSKNCVKSIICSLGCGECLAADEVCFFSLSF